MKNHAAAAAGTAVMMALISTTECFMSTTTTPTRSASRGSSSHPATTSADAARISSGWGSASPAARSQVGSTRHGSGDATVRLRLQSEGSGTPATGQKPPPQQQQAGGSSRRPPQRRQGNNLSSAKGTIDRKKQDEVEELKKSLKHLASLRMWRQATVAFDKAKADGLPLTSSTYSTMINVMSKAGRWKEALELLEEMIAGGPTGGLSGPKIAPSVVSYNAAITACARGNKMPKALAVLGQMHPRSGIKPDLYSYGSVLSGLAKARNPSRAIRLLDEMRAGGVEPDLVCLMSAMGACETKGASKESATVLEMIRELDPPPGSRTMTSILTSAISACVIEGAWEQATDWLTDIRMVNGGGVPPAAAYAAAANACARAGQAVRAQALIAELVGAGGGNGEAEPPTLDCFNAVVLGCAMSGDVEEALRTLREDIPRAGLKPDSQTLTHLLRAYARLKDWEAAVALLDEQRSGVFPNAPPNRHGFNAAIDACGRAGQVRPAIDLLDAMRAASRQNARLKPDHYSYGGALQACRSTGAGAGAAASALDLLRGMEKDRVKLDQRCALAAFSTVSAAAGMEDEATQILEALLESKTSTSEGALAGAKEELVEKIEAGGGGGSKFARALAVLEELETARAGIAASKAVRAAAVAADAGEQEQGVAAAAVVVAEKEEEEAAAAKP